MACHSEDVGKGDYSMVRCAVAYPKDLRTFVSSEFKRLKRRQFDDLGGEVLTEHDASSGIRFKEDMTPNRFNIDFQGDNENESASSTGDSQSSELTLAGLWDRVPFRRIDAKL